MAATTIQSTGASRPSRCAPKVLTTVEKLLLIRPSSMAARQFTQAGAGAPVVAGFHMAPQCRGRPPVPPASRLPPDPPFRSSFVQACADSGRCPVKLK